jgi:polyhydroxyalkanoic acid synthase PhaR subunit
MDPTELWSRWYETGSKMWSDVMSGNQESFMDPYGLYRQWFSGMEQMRDRMMSVPGMGDQQDLGGLDPQNLWSKWFEASVEGWQKTAQLGAEMMDMTPRWMQALDQARGNLMAAEKFPRDPLELTVQWYNATSGPISEFVQELIEREEFLEPSSRFLQNYASLYKVFRRNSEEYLSSLQLPVRSDITRVASLIVSLEDKVDRLEEAFEDFEYGYAEPATAENVGALEKSVESLDRRIDRVEGKLDQLLAAVEGISANGSPAETNGSDGSEAPEEAQPQEAPQEEIKATNAARRKAQELGVDLSQLQGSGADGQITVGDVREKGAS